MDKKDEFYSENNDILILGIGNFLMGDEGAGVHFIKNLDTKKFSENITFLDGGTGGFMLVPYIENHKIAIIVDAAMDGKDEGTVTLLKPKFSEDFPISLSGHNFGLKDMVEILSLTDKMPEIFLFTISIKKITPMCVELSPKVQAAVAKAEKKVLELTKKILKANFD